MREEIKFNPLMITLYLFFTILVAGVWLQVFTNHLIWHGKWELWVFLIATFLVVYKFSLLGFMGLFGTPAITLTERDIHITSSGYRIRWNDILQVELEEAETLGVKTYTTLLTLKYDNQHIYKPEDPLMDVYHKYVNEYNGPFKISMTELKGDNQSIYVLIEGFYLTYRDKV